MSLPSETGTASVHDADLYEAASRPATARDLWERWLSLLEEQRRLRLAGRAKLARGAANAAAAVALQACAQKAQDWDELKLKAIYAAVYDSDDTNDTYLAAMIEFSIRHDTDALQGR